MIEKETNKNNKFVSILSILFLIFLTVLVIFSFIKSQHPYYFYPRMIIVLTIMIVLILYEFFDKLEIINILVLQKKLNTTTKEKEKLEITII